MKKSSLLNDRNYFVNGLGQVALVKKTHVLQEWDCFGSHSSYEKSTAIAEGEVEILFITTKEFEKIFSHWFEKKEIICDALDRVFLDIDRELFQDVV